MHKPADTSKPPSTSCMQQRPKAKEERAREERDEGEERRGEERREGCSERKVYLFFTSMRFLRRTRRQGSAGLIYILALRLSHAKKQKNAKFITCSNLRLEGERRAIQRPGGASSKPLRHEQPKAQPDSVMQGINTAFVSPLTRRGDRNTSRRKFRVEHGVRQYMS